MRNHAEKPGQVRHVRKAEESEAELLRVGKEKLASAKKRARLSLRDYRDAGEKFAKLQDRNPKNWEARLRAEGLSPRTVREVMLLFRRWEEVQGLKPSERGGLASAIKALRRRDTASVAESSPKPSENQEGDEGCCHTTGMDAEMAQQGGDEGEPEEPPRQKPHKPPQKRAGVSGGRAKKAVAKILKAKEELKGVPRIPLSVWNWLRDALFELGYRE